MTRHQQVAPVTGEEFSTLLDQAGFNTVRFAEATGADRKRIQRWARGQEDVPLWAAMFLLAMKVPQARQSVLDFLAKYREPRVPQPRQSAGAKPHPSTEPGAPFCIEIAGEEGARWSHYRGDFFQSNEASSTAERYVSNGFAVAARVLNCIGSEVARYGARSSRRPPVDRGEGFPYG